MLLGNSVPEHLLELGELFLIDRQLRVEKNIATAFPSVGTVDLKTISNVLEDRNAVLQSKSRALWQSVEQVVALFVLPDRYVWQFGECQLFIDANHRFVSAVSCGASIS